MEKARNFNDGILAKAAIIGMGVLGAAPATLEYAAINPDSVAAEDNFPARTAEPFDIGATAVPLAIEHQSTAPVTGTKEECLPKLLQPPHDIKAVMYHAGSGHQETLVSASYNGITGCDNWKRVEKYRLQVKKSGQWVGFEGHWWYGLALGDNHTNDAHTAKALDFASMHIYDECVNGHREPSRVQFRNSLKNLATGKFVATGKIKNHPIKTPGC